MDGYGGGEVRRIRPGFRILGRLVQIRQMSHQHEEKASRMPRSGSGQALPDAAGTCQAPMALWRAWLTGLLFKKRTEAPNRAGDVLGSLSDIDDLSSTFSKLNKVASEPTSAGVNRGWGSRESSSAAELAQDADFTNWFDQRAFDAEVHESKKWSSHPYASPPPFYGNQFVQQNVVYLSNSSSITHQAAAKATS
ncbi:UNVERIFIED_CONTAM: protein PAT12 [Sesamum calycinum]|uniref:Protein PAT12 n=1 Tax=Sesamum calycinum TaxID=2727403 RepID=A0AAW2ME03_9LAMI